MGTKCSQQNSILNLDFIEAISALRTLRLSKSSTQCQNKEVSNPHYSISCELSNQYPNNTPSNQELLWELLDTYKASLALNLGPWIKKCYQHIGSESRTSTDCLELKVR